MDRRQAKVVIPASTALRQVNMGRRRAKVDHKVPIKAPRQVAPDLTVSNRTTIVDQRPSRKNTAAADSFSSQIR